LDELLTTKELGKRWKKESLKTVRNIIKRYEGILKPIKVGREILVEPENVRRFEEGRRVYKEG